MQEELRLQTDIELLAELKSFIEINLKAYFYLKNTSINATSIAVRNSLNEAAMKKAALIRNLSKTYHEYTLPSDKQNWSLLLPQS